MLDVDARPMMHVDSQPQVDENGIYMYGHVPTPNQNRKGYLVFDQLNQTQIIGAYYQPKSEFDCFIGIRKNNHLRLQVYESQNIVATNIELTLDDLYRLPASSYNDYRLLEFCRNALR